MESNKLVYSLLLKDPSKTLYVCNFSTYFSLHSGAYHKFTTMMRHIILPKLLYHSSNMLWTQ